MEWMNDLWLTQSVVVLSVVLAALALVGCVRLRATVARQAAALQALREDLNAVCTGAVGVGEHLARLERRAYQMVRRQEQLEIQEPADFSYKRAIKMVRKGASVEEIMETCGLVRGEAELVVLTQSMEKAG